MRKHFKQIILAASIMILSVVSAFAADIAIQANQLPKAAQDFIKANFANDPIVYAEQDRNSFLAELQSGVEIDFDNPHFETARKIKITRIADRIYNIPIRKGESVRIYPKNTNPSFTVGPIAHKHSNFFGDNN